MNVTHFLISADDGGLARVDVASIDDQTLLEILVSTINGNEAFHDLNGNYLPITEWPGITCNAQHHVTGIKWFDDSRGGEIQLRWLPLTLEAIDLTMGAFRGTVETQYFSNNLMQIKPGKNRLSVSVSFETSPRQTQRIYLEQNRFSGEVKLTQLSETLCFI